MTWGSWEGGDRPSWQAATFLAMEHGNRKYVKGDEEENHNHKSSLLLSCYSEGRVGSVGQRGRENPTVSVERVSIGSFPGWIHIVDAFKGWTSSFIPPLLPSSFPLTPSLSFPPSFPPSPLSQCLLHLVVMDKTFIVHYALAFQIMPTI